MCLLAFGYDAHPQYALVFAGNRDEFYDRPTAPAAFWNDAPHVLAGRDLKEGGTWMGATRNGRWAVVTNVRDAEHEGTGNRSRGDLPATYLTDEPDPESYLHRVAARAHRYDAFNLLVGTPNEVYYFSTEAPTVRRIPPGVHGMSNDQLNTPWPKVSRAKEKLRACLDGTVDPGDLLALLDDRRTFPQGDLPDTGVPLDLERDLSPIFVEREGYGTRSSTVLLIERSGAVTFVERTFDRGAPRTTNRYSFSVKGASHETKANPPGD